MLHLLFYASLLPHQAPQSLLPNPRSTSGAAGRLHLPAKAGARQGGNLSTSITLQSLEAVPSDAINSATGLKEHVPWTLNRKLKCFKVRRVILSHVIRGTSDKPEIHIKQANNFCRSSKATKGAIQTTFQLPSIGCSQIAENSRIISTRKDVNKTSQPSHQLWQEVKPC